MTAAPADLQARLDALLAHAREQVEVDGASALLSDDVIDATCGRWWWGTLVQSYGAEQDLVDALVRERDLQHGDDPRQVLGDRAPATRDEAVALAAEDVTTAARRLILGPAGTRQGGGTRA